jgi:class 3 adenylate cyclase/tetratricopeptide (TPR) repeat protein
VSTRAVERRIVTVLFADLVGFTSLSESLDAEDVSIIQDAYFEAVRETIGRHGGELEKFVGDAAMAVFGAPRTAEDDAERAVSAGLALVAAVERLSVEVGLGEGALRLRVGVNSGEAVYGEATAERGPVTGDTVNVAARLQAAGEPGSVLVGAVTALAVGELAELEPLAPLELKGKAEVVRAWRVVGLHPERSRERALGGLDAPLIGREAELERLLAGLGTGRSPILVVAPPGVGKSRLLAELASVAQPARATVLRAQLRPDVLFPFEAVAQLVRDAGFDGSADRLRRAGLSEARSEVVAGALSAVLSPATDRVHAAPDERDQLFGAWIDGLDALTSEAPPLWLVEDVHWASRDLLAFLSRSAERERDRLVVATARPSVLEIAPEWCETVDVFHLPPLPETDVATLVHALVGPVLPAELVAAVAARSGGNALFVEELLRMWIGTGVLVREAGAWRLAALPQEVGLPPTVQAIYAAQLDDLEPSVRSGARRASVAGRRFPLEALEALGVSDPATAVDGLVRRALVGEPREDAALGATVRFRHALLRDTAYAGLSRADRSALHLRLAEWLADRPEEVVPSLSEAVARHFAAALDNAPALAATLGGRSRDEVRLEAAAWFERAAVVAGGVAAWESARTLAERALELTSDDEPLSRARRHEQLAQGAEHSAGVVEADTHAREALALYRAVEDREGISSAALLLGRLLYAQTRFAEAERLADELLSETREDRDAATVRLLVMRAQAALGGRDAYEAAGRDLELALEIAQELDDAELELTVLELATPLREERGDRDPGWGDLERAARRERRWPAVVNALRARAGDHIDDDPAVVADLLAPAAALAEAHGLVEQTAWCDYVLAEAGLSGGRWDEALESGLRSIAVGEKRGFSRLVYRNWFVLLPIAAARGSEDLLWRARPAFPAWGERGPSDSTYARIVVTAAQLRLAASGLDRPFVPEVEWTLPSFELVHAGPSWLAGLETIVEAWLAAGEREGAAEALGRMRASLEARPTSRLTAAVEALLCGRLALEQGDTVEGVAQARRSLGLLGCGAPWWRAKAIRLLEAVGEADATLVAVAEGLEARLRIR